MKAHLNHQWLHLTNFDSASPSNGAVVIHRFEKPGEYRIRFLRGESTIAQARLTVKQDMEDEAPVHSRFDLTKLSSSVDLSGGDAGSFTVGSKGYVSFTDSGISPAFSVVAEPLGHAAGFDSRRLGPGDLFALTLIRPGEYHIVNEVERYEGRISVSYPAIESSPYRPPEPLVVVCQDKAFEPGTISLKPAQGLICRVTRAARIKVDLTRPDDGPPGTTDRPIVSFSREELITALKRARESHRK
jgi:hypothetical protein